MSGGGTLGGGTEHPQPARPMTQEDVKSLVRDLEDMWDAVALHLAWITASRWAEISRLATDHVMLMPDGEVVLDWGDDTEDGQDGPARGTPVCDNLGAGGPRSAGDGKGKGPQGSP